MTATVDAFPLTAWQTLVAVADPARSSTTRVVLETPLDPDAVTRVLSGVVARHPALRSRVDLTHACGPVQLVLAPSTQDSGAPDCAVRARLDGTIEVTMELAGPFLDAPSATLLAAELARACRSGVPGGQPTTGLRDLVALEACAAPVRHRAGTRSDAEVSRADAEVPGELLGDLRGRAAALDAPLSAVLLAAYLRVLGLVDGTATVWTGLLEQARDRAGIGADALGDFRALRPVGVSRDAPNWSALVRRTADALDPDQPALEVELPDALLELREAVARESGVLTVEHRERPVVACTLTVEIRPEGEAATLHLCRRGGAADEVLAHYLTALAHLASDPDRDPRSATTLLGPDAARPLVAQERDLVPPDTLHGLVAAQADRTPAASAVVDGDDVVTYADLADRVRVLSARLAAAGARPGGVVGVYMPRGADLVTALLAVSATGAAFLPVDVDYPRRRCELALAGADLVLSRSDAADRLDCTRGAVLLDHPADVDTPAPDPGAVRPESLAYLLHTSGSTGSPKAVAVPHAAAVNHMRWMVRALGLGPGDRVAQRTAVAFDAALWEFFAPLTCGATVVAVPSAASRDVGALEDLVREREITVLQLVPSLLGVLAEAGALARCPRLRLICCGGDALAQTLADRVLAQTDASLVNLYGPTENCVDTTWARARSGAGGATVPIGGPVTGTRLHVLDETAEPVPPGTPGELYVGGPQLAWGYRGRPADTAARFVPDHLSGRPGERLYRTGDRVRVLLGGELEFLGRTDRQVKVRGVRTEPGEVEAALTGHPTVREAVVVADRDHASALTAYLVPARDTERGTDVAELREHLRTLLPDAMVPTTFVEIHELPLQPNGKVDRRRLADLGAADRGYRPPAGPVEERLARLWRDVLGVDAVGRHDEPVRLGAGPAHALRFAALARRDAGTDFVGDPGLTGRTVAHLARTHRSG